MVTPTCVHGLFVALALIPSAVGAQPLRGIEVSQERFQRSISEAGARENRSWRTSPLQSAQGDRITRGGWIALGAGIGGGAGLVVGEYVFGRMLDLPHGPDMVLGGAIGAGTGALIAWRITRGTPDANASLTVSPVITRSQKGLFVRFIR